MSEPNEGTLHILQDGFRVIHENSDRMLALSESGLERMRVDRAEADRRFAKQARKLRLQGWALAFVIVLGIWNNIQTSQESARRDERAQVAEGQRRCAAELQNGVLARLSTLATATQNRVSGSSAVDPGAMAKLREDVASSSAQTDPDPVLLTRVRDQVQAILATIQADSPENRHLREEVATANDRLVRVREICFTDHPAENPLDR